MCCFKWAEDMVKKLNCCDVGVLKVCVFAFALMLAKLWPPLLSLPWGVYGAIFLVTYLYLLARIFGKGCCSKG